MANRTLHPVNSAHVVAVPLAVSFTTIADSSVSAQSAGSASFVTITKPAGVGIYRATFTDAWPGVLGLSGSVLVAAGALDGKFDPVAITNAGTATPLVVDFQFRLSSTGAAADPGAATFYMNFLLRNSANTP